MVETTEAELKEFLRGYVRTVLQLQETAKKLHGLIHTDNLASLERFGKALADSLFEEKVPIQVAQDMLLGMGAIQPITADLALRHYQELLADKKS